jgi:hypothetical protein
MASKPRTARTGKYDGMPVDRARHTDEDPDVTCRESEFFAQENDGGMYRTAGETPGGVAKGNRSPAQHPAPADRPNPQPFKNLRGGR